MKNSRFFTSITATLLFIAALAPLDAAHAQSVSVRANVPFSFVMNDRVVPAGVYEFRSLGIQSHAWRVEHAGISELITPTPVGQGASSIQPCVRFHRFADQNYFAGFELAHSASAYVVNPGKREIEVAGRQSPTNVMIAGQ